MNMRTPLSKVRGHGSAKDGTDHFWRQRVTAVANVPLTLFLVYVIIANIGSSHAEMQAFIGQPIVAVLLLALMVSGALHMKLGMQVIIEDYVHAEGAKIICLLLNSFFSIGVGLVAAFAILKIGFGG